MPCMHLWQFVWRFRSHHSDATRELTNGLEQIGCSTFRANWALLLLAFQFLTSWNVTLTSLTAIWSRCHQKALIFRKAGSIRVSDANEQLVNNRWTTGVFHALFTFQWAPPMNITGKIWINFNANRPHMHALSKANFLGLRARKAWFIDLPRLLRIEDFTLRENGHHHLFAHVSIDQNWSWRFPVSLRWILTFTSEKNFFPDPQTPISWWLCFHFRSSSICMKKANLVLQRAQSLLSCAQKRSLLMMLEWWVRCAHIVPCSRTLQPLAPSLHCI